MTVQQGWWNELLRFKKTNPICEVSAGGMVLLCLASLTKWWSIMVRSPGLDFEPLMTTSCLSCHVIWLPTWASLNKSHITVSHHNVEEILVRLAFKPLSFVKWQKLQQCHHLVSIFSCPEQLNRWPCHWLTHSVTHWATFVFYRTQVNLGSDLWVRMSVRHKLHTRRL